MKRSGVELREGRLKKTAMGLAGLSAVVALWACASSSPRKPASVTYTPMPGAEGGPAPSEPVSPGAPSPAPTSGSEDGGATDAAAPGGAATPESAGSSSRTVPAKAARRGEVAMRFSAEGRLLATPGSPQDRGPRGLTTLEIAGGRRALLYAPTSLAPGAPAPLVIVFHGRGGSAERGLGLLRDAADANGLLLLAPEAAGETWDVLHDGTFGADVRALDRALEQVFAHYAVDPKLIATAGFSDGASYALSVGLTNGQLVTHVLAYSPGLLRVQTPEGAPSVFLSHGSEDRDLPIAATSRLVVPALRKNGYQVRFDEFRGGHSIPPDLLRDSVGWFLGRQPSGPAFVPAVGTQRERAAPILPVARH